MYDLSYTDKVSAQSSLRKIYQNILRMHKQWVPSLSLRGGTRLLGNQTAHWVSCSNNKHVNWWQKILAQGVFMLCCQGNSYLERVKASPKVILDGVSVLHDSTATHDPRPWLHVGDRGGKLNLGGSGGEGRREGGWKRRKEERRERERGNNEKGREGKEERRERDNHTEMKKWGRRERGKEKEEKDGGKGGERESWSNKE